MALSGPARTSIFAAVVVAFCATVVIGIHLDHYLTANYLRAEYRSFFSSYTMWSHAYCGMVLMTWLVAINNVHALWQTSGLFRVRTYVACGIALTVLVFLALQLRTAGAEVALPEGYGSGSPPCVPIKHWLHTLLFWPAAGIALTSSVAVKLRAMVAAHDDPALGTLLVDSLLDSLLAEALLFIFVVLEIALIWYLQSQCDTSFVPSGSSPGKVAAHFANAASIGMFLLLVIPSAGALHFLLSQRSSNGTKTRQVRKSILAMAGSVLPAIAAIMIQSWTS